MGKGIHQTIFIITVILFSSKASALRKELCSSLGKGMEALSSERCQKASAAEYELACAMSSYGASFKIDDSLDFKKHKQYGYSTESGLAEALTDEVLMNLAANQIAESNQCMVNFYGQFSDTPSGPSQMGQLTRKMYTGLQPALQSLLPKSAQLRQAYLTPSSKLVTKVRTIDNVLKDSQDGPRVKFDALIASIPLGNHEEIRRYVAKATINNYSEDQFFKGYLAEVKKLKSKHQSSVNVMRSYQVSPNKKIYNVREGVEGSANLREALQSSGAIENFIITSGSQKDFENGYLCRKARTDKGCIALSAIEITGGLLVPSVAASFGLRAGLAMASRGSSSWSAAQFLGSAISRGLLFSGYIGQLALVSDDAVSACLREHPQYLQSKARESCEPEKMAFEATSEASLANCISTVALGIAPLGVGSVLSDSLKGMKVGEVVSEVVVTAKKGLSVKVNSIPPKEFYRSVYNNYEQVFPDEIIRVLNKTDEALDPSRASLGTVFHEGKIAGTWRVYEATRRSKGDPGDLLPYMRSNALRNVPALKADEIIKKEIDSGKRVAEMGKFSVDYRLPPEARGEVVETIEKNWIKLADKNPEAVLVAHVGTKLHVRLYRKYGFKVIEEYKVPGTDITEWILTTTGKEFSDTLKSIK